MFIMFFMFIIVYPLWFWSKILKPGSVAAQAADGWSLSMSLRLSCRYHHHSSRFQLNHFDKFVCHSWNKLFEVTDYLQCICAPLFFMACWVMLDWKSHRGSNSVQTWEVQLSKHLWVWLILAMISIWIKAPLPFASICIWCIHSRMVIVGIVGPNKTAKTISIGYREDIGGNPWLCAPSGTTIIESIDYFAVIALDFS